MHLGSIYLIVNDFDKSIDFYEERVKSLNISETITNIKYVCNVSHYYYFQITDLDGNVIEVTGAYTPKEGEFDE